MGPETSEVTLEALALYPLVKQRVCNGAGPKGFGWLVPDLWMREAADQHDLRYWIGGGHWARLRADVEFFANALLLAVLGKPWKLAWRWVVALLYFLAVRLGGWAAFNWTKRPRTMEYVRHWNEELEEAAYDRALADLTEGATG